MRSRFKSKTYSSDVVSRRYQSKYLVKRVWRRNKTITEDSFLTINLVVNPCFGSEGQYKPIKLPVLLQSDRIGTYLHIILVVTVMICLLGTGAGYHTVTWYRPGVSTLIPSALRVVVCSYNGWACVVAFRVTKIMSQMSPFFMAKVQWRIPLWVCYGWTNMVSSFTIYIDWKITRT